MKTWAAGDIVANGIHQHYYRTGGERPALVLLHGAGDAGLCWTPIAEALARDYDVVMPDARGHGLTESPEDGYGAGDRAADVAALIRELDLGRPIVTGHSMGAMTALSLGADYPDLVRALILEDPVFRLESHGPVAEEERQCWVDRSRHELAEMKSLGRDGIVARQREENPTWPEGDYGPWADARLQGSGAYIGKVRFPETPGWRELVERLRVPTLLVTADTEHGAIVSTEAAAEAERLNPLLQAVHITGAGHNIRREQYDAYLDVVRDFLGSLASRSAVETGK